MKFFMISFSKMVPHNFHHYVLSYDTSLQLNSPIMLILSLFVIISSKHFFISFVTSSHYTKFQAHVQMGHIALPGVYSLTFPLIITCRTSTCPFPQITSSTLMSILTINITLHPCLFFLFILHSVLPHSYTENFNFSI